MTAVALRLLPALLLLFLWSPAAARAACDLGQPAVTERVEIGRTGRSMLLHLPRGILKHRQILIHRRHDGRTPRLPQLEGRVGIFRHKY